MTIMLISVGSLRLNCFLTGRKNPGDVSPNAPWESTKKLCKLGDPQEVKLKDTKPQERGTNEVIFCGFHRYENNAMLDMYLQLEVFLWHSK